MPNSLTYLHVLPNGDLPSWKAPGAFRCIVIGQADVAPGWRSSLSDWMVHVGCRYMMAWGRDCSRWDDAVDDANPARFAYGDIPEDQCVMTTWHENETLSELFWFAKALANHPTVPLNHTVLLHIAPSGAETEMREAFANAKD